MYINDTKAPYNAEAISLYTTAESPITAISKQNIIVPTLTLGYFNFISIETISDPPLVLPLLNIHPKPTPIKTAPNAQNINLFPQNSGKIAPKRFDVNEIVIMVKALFIQNSLLKYINASTKSGTFSENKKEPKSSLLRIQPIKLAMPAKPPNPALFGNTKQRQPMENNIMPARSNARFFANLLSLTVETAPPLDFYKSLCYN